jgi:hypothetical protein
MASGIKSAASRPEIAKVATAATAMTMPVTLRPRASRAGSALTNKYTNSRKPLRTANPPKR